MFEMSKKYSNAPSHYSVRQKMFQGQLGNHTLLALTEGCITTIVH